MVSELGSSSPGSSPGQGHNVVFMGTQVYKWVLANLMLGVTLRWTGIHPGGVAIFLVA